MSVKKWFMAVFSATLLVLVMGSCQDPTGGPGNETAGGPVPDILKSEAGLESILASQADLDGNWVSPQYSETFAISLGTNPRTLTYTIGSMTIYAGNIVRITADDFTWTSGYIYIQYTTALDPTWVGHYYAVRWESLVVNPPAADTIWLSGCSDGPGKTRLADAIRTYTKAAGYFNSGSDCTKATASTLTTTSVSAYSPFLLDYARQAGYTLPALPILP
jgi:hypothetical protein